MSFQPVSEPVSPSAGDVQFFEWQPAAGAPMRLAYKQQAGTAPVGVVFVGGWLSDMTGSKAAFLAEWCGARAIPFLRYDHPAHGQSGGELVEFSISQALAALAALLRATADRPQILVGSSLGGWVALRLAGQPALCPVPIAGVVGIAAAPDFLPDLMWPALSTAQQQALQSTGQCEIFSELRGRNLRIGYPMFEDATQHLLLRERWPLPCPLHLLQGQDDAQVPWPRSLRLLECVKAPAASLTLIKDGDHRLTRASDLQQLAQRLEQILAGGGEQA